MAIVITGTLKMLKKYLSAKHTLKLYTNDKTPAVTDTVTDYTEAKGGGYKEVELIAKNWNYEILSDKKSCRAIQAKQSFVFKGPLAGNDSVRGYYIIDEDADLVLATAFVKPFAPANIGDQIDVTPAIRLNQKEITPIADKEK